MPNPPGNALPVSGLDFSAIDIEAPLIGSQSSTCDRLRDCFGQACRKTEEEGKKLECQLFESLLILCGFRQNFHDQADPYAPLSSYEEKRSAIPADLSSADLDTVAILWERASTPILRARLGDLLFLRRKNHKAALDAVNQYIEAGNQLLTQDDWIHCAELFKRALQLAGYLGRGKEPWKKAELATLTAINNPLALTAKFFSCKLLKVAAGLGIGEPVALAGIAHEHAIKASSEKDYRREREYLLLEVTFHHQAQRVDEAAKVRLLVAETYISESEAALQRPEPSYFAASHFLAHGIEALRQASGDTARISELRKRLLSYQQESMKEMQPLGFDIDMSETAEAVMKYVHVPSLEDAIERLALGIPPINVEELRESIIENAKQAPLAHLLGMDIVDQQGRLQKSTGSLLGATGDQAEKEMEARMFQTAARSNWPCRAVGIIHPGRTQIWADHAFTALDLAYLVQHNPFIPQGHEAIFMRGLFYGFAGDMLLASHLLVPQLENSIRYVLECNGADITNLKSDLTQPVKLLGPLFDLPEMEKIFGKNLKFELRGLLIEKTGCGLRNNLAHGFITEAEGYGHAATNSWWLTLHLCAKGIKIIENRTDI